MIQDHQPINIGPRMMGLFDRGNEEACPLDHFITCQNVEFVDDGIKRRTSFTATGLSNINIKRIHVYKLANASPRILYLVNDGAAAYLYVWNFIGSPTLLDTLGFGVIDFNIVIANNRVYISYMAYAGSFAAYQGSGYLYVYDNTTYRIAGGSAPATAFTPANSATVGNVTAGYHGLAYAYETASGFITPPKKIAASTFNATGGFKIDLTGILNGPSGTVKKHLLATRAYDASVEPEPEFFFIDEEVINDNTTTSKTIDFFDQQLVRSADYLFDLYTQIPCGAAIAKYNNRVVIGGLYQLPSNVIVSKAGQPESFDQVDGIIQTDPDESEYVSNISEYRGQLMIFKDSRTYSTADNGREPVNWGTPITIDGGIGSTPFGVSNTLDTKKPTFDGLIVASRSGLHYFTGSYNSIPLSYKIESYWRRITWAVAPLIQVLVDTRKKRIYCGIPYNGSGAVNIILVCDYQLGLSPDLVRWSVWEINGGALFGLAFKTEASDGEATLMVANIPNVSSLDSTQTTTDTGNPAVLQTAYVGFPNSLNISHFAAYRLKVAGAATITPTIYSQDDSRSKALSTLTFAASPGKEITRRILFQAEKASLTLSFGYANTNWTLQNLVIFAKELWRNRPYA